MSAAGLLHVLVIANIYDILKPLATENALGYVVTHGLHCALSTGQTHVPDVAFIRRERIPPDYDLNDPFPGAPDLAVEVAVPDESQTALVETVRAYLNAGAEQVWIVYPAAQEVHQYRRDDLAVIRVYRGGDPIKAGDLFPGLLLPVNLLFAIP